MEDIKLPKIKPGMKIFVGMNFEVSDNTLKFKGGFANEQGRVTKKQTKDKETKEKMKSECSGQEVL